LLSCCMLSSALASMAVKLLAETFLFCARMYVTKHCVRSGVQVGLGLRLLAHGNELVLVFTWKVWVCGDRHGLSATITNGFERALPRTGGYISFTLRRIRRISSHHEAALVVAGPIPATLQRFLSWSHCVSVSCVFGERPSGQVRRVGCSFSGFATSGSWAPSCGWMVRYLRGRTGCR
jgi:hypothetical protein